jgi:DNA-binding response OmpR family regulator
MGLECLAITRDTRSLETLQHAAEKLSIKLEACRGVNSGREVLMSEKYDGVIIDCDDLQGGLELLEQLRRTTSNKTSVSFAMLNGGTTTKKAFEVGANFVLQKPLLPLTTLRCLSAAFGQMTRERRRYFRVPVEMGVTLIFENCEIRATATNLSEGGMAIKFRGKFPAEGVPTVQFTLPTTSNSLETKADLAWADGSGHAGLRFMNLTQLSKEHLERWLSTRMEAAGVV